ncbi:MAG: DegT/DnrJ/EryC1/StrS family aminotransferase [Deltaproteobacteria bacterium]|nr:DegT/DnrJ/EryC1/StrS family aminotransferase [Deltaproteobacteria bacterium]
MALGKIPRFSPSFSPREALTVMHRLARPGDEDTRVRSFEEAFAARIGTRHGIMVPSARYGLVLLVRALGFQPGDEVIVPALTFFAVPAVLLAEGLRVVPADTGLRTHVLDPEAFERAITPRTRAVIPTHLFGTPCDMGRIREIADRHDLKVIEDTAQATGASFRGRAVGSFGHVAYYTFGLTKNMTTLSGAMVTTDDDAVAEHVRAAVASGRPAPLEKSVKEAITGSAMMVATHPWVYPFTVHPVIVLGNRLGKDPIHERFGEAERRYDTIPEAWIDARPRGVQAAVGLRQLERLDRLNGARAANGRRLDEALADVPGLEVPEYPEGAEPIYLSFVVHHDRREDLAAALRRRGVDTTIGYMANISDHSLFPEIRNPDACPNAARAFHRLLHLPVHPNLTPRDLDHMVEAVRSACREIAT